MKKIVLSSFVVLICILSACTEKSTTTVVTIRNLSNQKIAYLHTYDFGYTDTIILQYSYAHEYSDHSMDKKEGMSPEYLITQDSVQIIYNDSISIIHIKKQPQTIKRSLYNPAAYTGGKAINSVYHYEYIFTDADYEEALQCQSK